MNKHYMKGYRKERNLVNAAKALGCLAFRSAGSHSPVDVIIIDSKQHMIHLIQAKAGDLSEAEKTRIKKANDKLNGIYKVQFTVK